MTSASAKRLSIAREPADAAPRPVPSPLAPSPLVFTARQFAAVMEMSERGIRKLNSAGLIPRPIRIGRSVRWRAAEIEAWLAAGAPSRDKWEATR